MYDMNMQWHPTEVYVSGFHKEPPMDYKTQY